MIFIAVSYTRVIRQRVTEIIQKNQHHSLEAKFITNATLFKN